MKTLPRCLDCFRRQARESARLATDDPTLRRQIVERAESRAGAMFASHSPTAIAREVQRVVGRLTGVEDPYVAAKRRHTELTLDLLPELEHRVSCAADPFDAAARLAIAGNIIDLAFGDGFDRNSVIETIEDSLTRPLAVDELDLLRAVAAASSTILYIGDNAGEIVLDRPLIRRLPPGSVTFVVRGGAILNDATLADARAGGLDAEARIVDNGSDIPGTALEECTPEIRELFGVADLVIAKGQGNFETLFDQPRDVFHLLKVKCPVVAELAGCGLGEMVAGRRRR